MVEYTHTHTHTSSLETKKGITLIALVITIIVLLILAGVTVATLTGENGLLSKAQLAKERTAEGEQDEKDKLSSYENEMDNYGTWERTGGTGNITVSQNSTNTMSGTEHFIGEYYLDGKPIYAKTLYIASLPKNSRNTSYNHGATDVENIWFDTSKCYMKWQAGQTAPLSFLQIERLADCVMLGSLTSTSFQIWADSDRSSCSGYVTINYTKATDTATITTPISATPAN